MHAHRPRGFHVLRGAVVKISTMGRENFWTAAEQARSRGKDLAEVLDREGYLLTPQRLHQIQADTIDMVVEMLATSEPLQWTRDQTLGGLQRSITSVLRGMAKDIREGK